MATNLYADGLGGTVDPVITNQPFYGFDAAALYVHFATGVDPVSGDYLGRDRYRPLKTLAKAVQTATANDVIVLLDGHDEVLTAGIPVDKAGLVIAGCGQTVGVPNVRLRLDNAVGAMLSVTATCVQLRNIHFLPNVQLNPAPKIAVTSSGFLMDGCHVELSEMDYVGLQLGAGSDFATIRDSTFLSVATAAVAPLPTAQPFAGVINFNTHSGLTLDGLVVDDGAYGFANYYSLDLSASPATNLRADRLSLLRGASAKLGTATGYILPTVSGGGAIDT